MRKLLLTGLTLATIVGQADVWRTKKGSGSDSHLNPAFWMDAATGTVSPSALSADDEYWSVASQAFVARKFDGASVFPGTLYLGASTQHKPFESLTFSQSWGTINGKDSLTFPNLIWYNGRFYNNMGNKTDHTLTYGGTFTLRADDDHAVSTAPQFGLTVSGSPARCLTISANLVSEDDKPVVTVYGESNITFADLVEGHSWVRLSGDNAAFKGTFAVNGGTYANAAIRIASDTALGDPSVVTNAALCLGSKSGLLVESGVTLSANRGIRVTGDDTYFITGSKNGGDIDLPCPVTKAEEADARVILVGPGTTTFRAAYAAGELVASNGATVVFAPTATIADRQKVTLLSGATLRATFNQYVQMDLTAEENVTLDISPLTVPFDGTETTPVAFTISSIEEGKQVPLVLSQPIPLPLNASNSWVVATVPNGHFTAEDFVDRTEKASGLPTTWFEVETAQDGTQTIRLAARPTIIQEGQRWNDKYNDKWFSDGVGIHPGADYAWFGGEKYGSYSGKPRNSAGINLAELTFAGESFTVSGGSLQSFVKDWTISDLRLLNNATLECVRATTSDQYLERHVYGAITVGGDSEAVTNGILSTAAEANYTRPTVIHAPIRGTGTLKFSGYWGNTTYEYPHQIYAYGDNSGFTGKLLLEGHGGSQFFEYVVTNANAFGGSPDTFQADGVLMTHNWSNNRVVTVRATQDLTIDDPNRGWTVYRGNFRVDQDVTLTFKSVMKISGNLGKDGPGVMAFGGQMTSAHPFLVREGYIAALTTNALDRAQITFGSLTDGGIAIDGAAESDGLAEYGMVQVYEVTPPPADVKIKVKLVNWSKEQGSITRAILTVPATAADLSNAFDLRATGDFNATLSTRTNPDGSTTYLATFQPSGFLILIK